MTATTYLPVEVTIYGKKLQAIGRGKYPYDCEARAKHPNAMIYMGDCAWTDEHSMAFEERDQSLDVHVPMTVEPSKEVITLTCEEFSLGVSIATGRVLSARTKLWEPSRKSAIEAISHFDIAEAREWLEGFSVDPIEGATLDFPAVGYWKKDGTYVAPDEEHRIDLQADQCARPGMHP